MDWYIGNEWRLKHKGLYKKVVSLEFQSVNKPQVTSLVAIRVDNVTQLNNRPSVYLATEVLGQLQSLQLGTALTAVDCYVELLVQQMFVGETAECHIETSNGEPIIFEITLEQIVSGTEIHKLTVSQMYDLALRYKENGVAMFKQYPKFAHDYFARAAKCLISYKPFDSLTKKDDGVDASDMNTLLVQLQTNLAACLLNEGRYEDVIYQTTFVDTMIEPSEKSVYRRALAYYHLKEFEKAQSTLALVPNYEEKREFAKLRDNIASDSKDCEASYKQIVQRMFS